MYSNCILLIILSLTILEVPNVSEAQRISVKKCEEYTNLFRREYEDVIFMTKEYGTLNCPVDVNELVIGGRDANPNEYPSMVLINSHTQKNQASLLTKDSNGNWLSICGGTLISENYILTAAHCLTKKNPDKISLGEINLAPSKFKQNRRDLGVERVIIHPEYKPPSSYHDIALIQLDKKIPLTFGERTSIRPACLTQFEVSTGALVTAAGWGRTSAFGDISDNLQVVTVPVTDRTLCSDFFRDTLDFDHKFPGVQDKGNWQIPEKNVCAGTEGKDTCQGDSGGPLYFVGNKNMTCVNYVAGITSFGSTHCGSSTPGVYTKVSAYLDWIEGHVWPNN